MRNLKRILPFIAVATAAVAPPAVLAQEAAEPSAASEPSTPASRVDAPAVPSFDELYADLAANNIFRRDRRPPPPRVERDPEPPAPPPPPETQWLLTGVVWEEGAFRGYLEYLPDGSVRRVTTGDAIANGNVGELYIDSISYVGPEGGIFWVDVGDDLTGEPSRITVSRSSSSSSGGESAGEGGGERGRDEASGGGDGENLSPIERMRRRRQEQMGG